MIRVGPEIVDRLEELVRIEIVAEGEMPLGIVSWPAITPSPGIEGGLNLQAASKPIAAPVVVAEALPTPPPLPVPPPLPIPPPFPVGRVVEAELVAAVAEAVMRPAPASATPAPPPRKRRRNCRKRPPTTNRPHAAA